MILDFKQPGVGGLAIVGILILLHSQVRTQDRLPPIPAGQMSDAQKKAVAEFQAARSADLTGPFFPLLRSPELMTRVRAVGDYVRFRSALPPRLSEFVILIVARHWTQQYEWAAHYPIAIGAGVKPEIAAAIAEGRRPPRMSEEEEVLYEFVSELQQTQGVSNSTYAAAVAKLGERAVVDTLGICGYYTMIAMVLNTARTPPPATTTAPPLAPLPR